MRRHRTVGRGATHVRFSAEDPATDPATEPEPAEPTHEGVDPATGEEHTVGPVSFRVPEGYRAGMSSDFLLTFQGPELQSIGVGAQESLREQSLDDLAAHPSTLFGNNTPRRMPDRELAGTTFYHLTGEGAYGRTDEFGTSRDGYSVQLNFSDFGSDAERTRWVESVLATLTWR